MLVESVPVKVREYVQQLRGLGNVVGVVPTMGALHEGHVSLMRAAAAHCDNVVATIFVNPTQFGPKEDFSRYPRTLEQDLEKCEAAGVDLVFTPDTSQMYSADAETVVQCTRLPGLLEGAVRPVHFCGVTTVVAKLFNITIPDRAYFGQKDYQQQLIIRRMVRDLDWGIEIVTCPIVREPDGLAMSSRNRYLSPEERSHALVLFRALQTAQRLAEDPSVAPDEIERSMTQLITSERDVELDYAVLVDGETLLPMMQRRDGAVALVAAKLGKTRLIDNQRLLFR